MNYLRVCSCGGTPIVRRSDAGLFYYAQCVTCGATPPDGMYLTSKMALEHWNEWRRKSI